MERNSAQPELLEKILYKGNLNRAYKRVKANKGAPGIDGTTVEEIGAYLKENQQTIIARIYFQISLNPLYHSFVFYFFTQNKDISMRLL